MLKPVRADLTACASSASTACSWRARTVCTLLLNIVISHWIGPRWRPGRRPGCKNPRLRNLYSRIPNLVRLKSKNGADTFCLLRLSTFEAGLTRDKSSDRLKNSALLAVHVLSRAIGLRLHQMGFQLCVRPKRKASLCSFQEMCSSLSMTKINARL